MKVYCTLAIFLGVFTLGQTYSKYGRTCKDIGCRSTEVCVMESDPCSYRRQGDCGAYPTCKKNSNGIKPSCSTYVCPPTKVCKMDGETPKCIDDHSKMGHVGYDTQASGPVQSQGSSQNSGTSGSSGSNIYPSIPNQQPAPNNNNRQQPPYNQGGYAGYPGQQQGGYQQPAGGYPSYQGGYQQPGQQQYPGGYPGYQGGYQQPGGYPQGGYPNYPQGQGQGQGGYNPYGPSTGQKNSGSSFISDALTDSLKTIGTDLLKNAFSKILKNGFSGGASGTNTNTRQ